MAMSTSLISISADDLKTLRANPAQINSLVPDWDTYYPGVVNFVLTGTAWPDQQPLAAVVYGGESVDAPTLENGSFGVVEPAAAKEMFELLDALNVESKRDLISEDDFETLIDEEEMYELELVDPLEIGDVIVEELAGLVEFYRDVANAGAAVVMFTS